MSSLKKGKKFTISTDNGISRSSDENNNQYGILEISGPGVNEIGWEDDSFEYDISKIPQLVIGATDYSGIFQIGVNNNGDSFLAATWKHGNKDLFIQRNGGRVGVGMDNIKTTPSCSFHINATDALIIPVGNTSQRPGPGGPITAENGMIRYNTQTNQFEGYGPGDAWGSLGGVKDVDGDTYISAETSPTTDNDDLQFYTGGHERMIVNSSGNVGIGISPPSYKLDVNGTACFVNDVTMNDNLTVDDYVGIGIPASNLYRLNVNGTANFTGDVSMNNLTVDDKVGIGTSTTPSGDLEIKGSDEPHFRLTHGSNSLIYTQYTHWSIDSYNNELRLNKFSTRGVTMCEGGGNVGIGETSPSYKLYVNGTSRFVDNVTMNDDLTVDEYVGIGIPASNSYKLYVSGGNSRFTDDVQIDGRADIVDGIRMGVATVRKCAIYIDKDCDNDELIICEGSRCGARFKTNRATVDNSYFDYCLWATGSSDAGLIVRNNGNVGIGSVNSGPPMKPRNKLDVSGGVVIGSSYSETTDAPSNGLLVEGQVGIGTDTIEPPNTNYPIAMHCKGQLSLYTNETDGSLSMEATGERAGKSNIIFASNNWYHSTTSSREKNGLIWKAILNNVNWGSERIIDYNKTTAGIYFTPEANWYRGGLSFWTNGAGEGVDGSNTEAQLTAVAQSDAVERMRISNTGYVGIGTNDPACPLEVATYKTLNIPSGRAYWYTYEQAHSKADRNLAIKAGGAVWSDNSTGFIATSDRRIKKNIVDVPDNLALEMVRKIPCRYYEYKDNLYSGTDKTVGFIAQEVAEVLPMAISIQTSIIPNEMRKLENVSWEQIENTYKLITDLQDVSGVKYRFYVSNDVSGNEERKEIIGNSDNTFTFDSSYNNVFCYGKEVDDFHTLDKQKIFALHHSAIQEIDRIQQQHIIDISNAQTTIQQHETTIQTLQTDLSTANTTIQQHETTIQQHETTIQQHETTIQQHETTIQQHETTIQQHETTIQQHETTIQQHETTIQQHETTIQQQATTIQQQQQQIADILSRLESLESSA